MTVGKIEVTEATNEDMIRFYGSGLDCPWEGKVMKEGRQVLGFAGVLVLHDGTVWGFMDIRNKSRKKMVFRHVLLYLKELNSRGINKVRVSSDTKFSKADLFLERLGFNPTEDFDENGLRIWEWQA